MSITEDDLKELLAHDDLQAEIEERLTDPEYRAAREDALAAHRILDSLVRARENQGVSQSEVARRMGVRQPTVSRFENEGSDPRLSSLQRYARAIGGCIRVSFVIDAGPTVRLVRESAAAQVKP